MVFAQHYRGPIRMKSIVMHCCCSICSFLMACELHSMIQLHYVPGRFLGPEANVITNTSSGARISVCLLR
jgi:hypothetical protein